MRKSVAALATVTVVAGGLAVTVGSAQADGPERTKRTQCSGAKASLSLQQKKSGRIEAEFEVEHAAPGSSWGVRIKHNRNTILRTQRRADDEGEWDATRSVRGAAGKDVFVARAIAPTGQVCRLKLGI